VKLRVSDYFGHQIYANQAHNGDINAVAIGSGENSNIIASCGRDRIVQVFRKNNTQWDLLQSCDNHAASVTDVIFSNRTAELLSISSDRTISIRKMACREDGSQAYICVRVISLKASPVSLTWVPNEPDLVVISTMDRLVQWYHLSSGRLVHSFKISDPASNETMMMSSLEIHNLDESGNKTRVLIGVSSTDRSIRVHDYDSGLLLTKSQGQTAISAITLIQAPGDVDKHQQRLVSCGFDGTVMMWDLAFPAPPVDTSSVTSNVAAPPLNRIPTSNQPQRRILSRIEISSFQRCLESDNDTLGKIRDPLSSPTLVRRKTSRLSLATGLKSSNSLPSTVMNASYLPANESENRKSSQNYLLKGSSSQDTPNSKVKPPSLDYRRRSKSAANLNDLNEEAEHICNSLYSLRKRITSATIDKLDATTAEDLESELKFTSRALSGRVRQSQLRRESITGDLLDVHLAKMIDERLALRARSGGDRQSNGNGAAVKTEDQSIATAGAKDNSSDLA